jgi:hypothetical protein
MDYSKFTLGLRFAMTSDSTLTPEDCWNLIFSEVPTTYTLERHLFGAWDDVARAESESAYICMFSNLPLGTGKELYTQLRKMPNLLSYLTIYRPFIQNNLVEKCGKVEYLGEVQLDGSVTGGDVSYGTMQFAGTVPEDCKKNTKCLSVLIAPDSWEGKFTSADAARHMMRAAARKMPTARIKAHLIADGGLGTLDALVCSVNGRYVKAVLEEDDGKKTPLRYGVLPDETVVFESESLTKAQIESVLTLPQNRGYHNYIIAAGGGVLPETVPANVSATVLGRKIPAGQRNSSQIEYRSGAETILAESRFDFRLNKADWLIILSRMQDESALLQNATTDTLLFHSRSLNKHVAVLAFSEDGHFFAKFDDAAPEPLSSRSFDEAADELFLHIRKFLPQKKSRKTELPDTLISDQ